MTACVAVRCFIYFQHLFDAFCSKKDMARDWIIFNAMGKCKKDVKENGFRLQKALTEQVAIYDAREEWTGSGSAKGFVKKNILLGNSQDPRHRAVAGCCSVCSMSVFKVSQHSLGSCK